MSKRHKARVHKWIEGKLVIEERDFNTYDEAIIWYTKSGIETVKIYDEEGNLIFSGRNAIEGSYA
jgi:regulatory protein YycI of two-component signal transduction system YycFG